MTEEIDFILPNFDSGELVLVNSLEFTRGLILELIGKLALVEPDEALVTRTLEQLEVAVGDYQEQLYRYGNTAPKLIGAQLLLEEVVYKLELLLLSLDSENDSNIRLKRLKLSQLLNELYANPY